MQENSWGIYLKNEPITKIPMQDGAHMFRVTDIDPARLLLAIDNVEIEE